MKWDYWFQLFLEKHCSARGLRASTIVVYRDMLGRFKLWAQVRLGRDIEPDQIQTEHILQFVQFLREERSNGDSSIVCHVVTLRSFYKAIVALGQLPYHLNPTLLLPRIKPPKRKIRETLSQDEVKKLINQPKRQTVIGLRDRAILSLLYGTGIRASECAHLKQKDIDFLNKTVRVVGKGGHERVVPLNESVIQALLDYNGARGEQSLDQPFFKTRKKRSASRGVIYDRVRRFAKLSRLTKHVTPHVLRHTFATHLIRMGEKLVVLRDLLGHRWLSSTQVYLHMTGEDLRSAIDRHPVGKLLDSLGELLPLGTRLPFQYPPGTRFTFNN